MNDIEEKRKEIINISYLFNIPFKESVFRETIVDIKNNN